MSDIHTRYAVIRFRPDWLARNNAVSAWPIIEAAMLSLSGANCVTGIVTWILVQQQVSTMRDTVQTVKTFASIKIYCASNLSSKRKLIPWMLQSRPPLSSRLPL